VLSMLHDALDAFARLDSEQALRIMKEDKQVDEEYQAAARALLENTELSAKEIVSKALTIAGDICIYTNQAHVIESLD